MTKKVKTPIQKKKPKSRLTVAKQKQLTAIAPLKQTKSARFCTEAIEIYDTQIDFFNTIIQLMMEQHNKMASYEHKPENHDIEDDLDKCIILPARSLLYCLRDNMRLLQIMGESHKQTLETIKTKQIED